MLDQLQKVSENANQKQLKNGVNIIFQNVRSKEHIIELGKKLYIKITEVISSEVEKITEQECIDYMLQPGN